MEFRAVVLACAAATLALWVTPETASAAPTKDQCIDADTQAQDFRRDGKFLRAREALRLCAAEACPKLVRTDCTRRLDELDLAVPSITFEAKNGAGQDLSAVVVTMDGKPFADHLDGAAIDVDPGEHTFTFQAADLSTTIAKFVVHEGARGRREPITLGPLPAVAEAHPAAGSKPAANPPDTAETSGHPSKQSVAAIVAGGVGASGLVIGGLFWGIALSKKSAAKKSCPAQCADQTGVDAWSSAKSAGNVATVAFIVGGVGLAGGAILWFSAKPENSEASAARGVRLGMGLGTIQLKGTW